MGYEDSLKNGKRQEPKKPHNLSMEGRRKLPLSGVEEVARFDEQEIVVVTTEGSLYIGGEGLNVSRLSVDSGDISVQGLVRELRYEQETARGGLWARLFH